MTAAEDTVAAVTAYVLLRCTENATQFELVARYVQARSAAAAIRMHAEQAGDQADGLYVAVPARSWKPTKITTKVERTLVIEDAQ